jgi:hypothetical protein
MSKEECLEECTWHNSGKNKEVLFKLFRVKTVPWSEAGFPLTSECITPMQRELAVGLVIPLNYSGIPVVFI